MFNLPILVRVIQQALGLSPTTSEGGLSARREPLGDDHSRAAACSVACYYHGHHLSAGRVFGEAAALIYTAGQSAPMLDFTSFDFSDFVPVECVPPSRDACGAHWKINSEGVVPDWTRFRAVPLRCSWCAF